MTEAEWLNATDPKPMFDFHKDAASQRKLQLFRVACCERVEHLLTDARSRSALACLRRYTDGRVAIDELRAEIEGAELAYRSAYHRLALVRCGEELNPSILDALRGRRFEAELLDSDPPTNAMKAVAEAIVVAKDLHWRVARHAARAVEVESGPEAGTRERQVQSQLVRDLFSNPFRPVTLDPRWQSETVAALANGIYAERAFDRMPILADALEETGCDNADILAHCRGDGPHVRGCWVVDLILGKE